jgi:hypothetical protein
MRIDRTTAGTGTAFIFNKIEDVNTASGQDITFSFWAKSDALKSYSISIQQAFGSGGSGAVNTVFSAVNIGTTWAQYTVTGTVPSVSGKTIGAGSYLALRMYNTNIETFTLDLAQFKAEIGSTASMSVPLDPANRHYAEIMRQVEAGTLTILEAS